MKARRGKPQKATSDLMAMTQEELKTYVFRVLETISKSRSVEDRREIILDLLQNGLRRREIFNIVSPAFGIAIETLDDDIAVVKKWQLDWVHSRNRAQILLEVDSTNEAIIRRGLRTGDLGSANQANRLRASIHQLIQEGVNLGGSKGDRTPEDLRAEIGRKLKAFRNAKS